MPLGDYISLIDKGATVALSESGLSMGAISKESREEWAISVTGLKKTVHKVWRQVTLEYLNKLYESMPRQMQAVIQAQGGHTKY